MEGKGAAIYERYAEARDRAGMTDSEVAKATGIYQSTFSDWKSGRSCPKWDKLIKIARALRVSFEYLVGEEAIT